MQIEVLRDKLLKIRKRSAFKEGTVKVVDLETGDLFTIHDVVFGRFDNGITYIKVTKEKI